MEDAAIVWVQASLVKENTFLHYTTDSAHARDPATWHYRLVHVHLHLLKLFTGVLTSTRPVKRSGSPGKAKTRRILNAAATANNTDFGLAFTTFVVALILIRSHRS